MKSLNLKVKKTVKRIMLFCFYSFFFPLVLISQVKTTTNEYYKDNKIRRTLILDENLNILSETYFRQSNSLPITKVEYKSSNEISSVIFYEEDGINKSYFIDFVNGKYYDYSNQTELSFNENFVFIGKQLGDKIISNYVNGKRNGPVLQFDSTATGKVVSNKTFLSYDYVILNGEIVIITGAKATPIYDDKFTLYKGAYCLFKDDLLNGVSEVFYYNGKKKIQSVFSDGKGIEYSSFDKQGNVITKFKTNDGILAGKAIINGSIQEFENSNLVWFRSLNSMGKVYSKHLPSPDRKSEIEYRPDDYILKKIDTTYHNLDARNPQSTDRWNTGQLIKFKKDFDKKLTPAENIVELRLLLGIPYFFVSRYDFKNYDKDDFLIVKLNSNIKIDSTGLVPKQYILNDKKNLVYQRNPFFNNEGFHSNIDLNVLCDNYELDNEYVINEFLEWLNSTYNYYFSGNYDVFLVNSGSDESIFNQVNNNDSIIKFLESYTNSLISSCKQLYQKGNIDSGFIIDPIVHYKNPKPNIISNISFDFFDKGKSLFNVTSLNKRYLFNISTEEDATRQLMCYNLYDTDLGLRYVFSYRHYKTFSFVPEEDIDNEWVYIVKGDKSKTYLKKTKKEVEIKYIKDRMGNYQLSDNGTYIDYKTKETVEINQIDGIVKKSLEDINNYFH